jgi:16S rRNA (cytosine967-C5)-methyltransferase
MVSSISQPRLSAFRALTSIESGQSDLPTALARTRGRLDDERDRALTAEIVTGTLRWRGQLDALVEHFSRRPVSKLDPEILTVLRLSVYQILHLARVPAAAATNDAVALARHARKASAAAFVNAVLRSIVRERSSLPLPSRPSAETLARVSTDPAARAAALEYLTVTLSHPRWLAVRWLDRFGFDATVQWEFFNNAAAPLTLRANTLKTTTGELGRELRDRGVATRPTTYAPDGLIVIDGNPLQTPLADTGLFTVQDEASQLVATFAAPRRGDRVLDCCAAPGGKTTAMAAAMADDGLIVAADVRSKRLDLLRRTVERSGAHIVRFALVNALLDLPVRGTPFDLVLLDVPCSGLGTLRRDPDIRWRRKEEDLAPLAAAQRVMLDQASTVVRPGGRLVYATCSSEPDENEAVVGAFLTTHPSFSLVRPIVDPSSTGLAAVIDARGMLRTSPVAHGLEAFFAATLQRH